MNKQGMVSIWLGNIANENYLKEYVDFTYDEDGDSIPSKFFIDFTIDRNEIDEDFIEKVVLKEKSSDISLLLRGCSYEEVIIPNIIKKVNITRLYNAIILIYNFEYGSKVNSSGEFDFIITTSYE